MLYQRTISDGEDLIPILFLKVVLQEKTNACHCPEYRAIGRLLQDHAMLTAVPWACLGGSAPFDFKFTKGQCATEAVCALKWRHMVSWEVSCLLWQYNAMYMEEGGGLKFRKGSPCKMLGTSRLETVWANLFLLSLISFLLEPVVLETYEHPSCESVLSGSLVPWGCEQ